MDRDQYKFRAKARIVAFVDLILSSMSLCLILILFVGLLRITSLVPSGSGDSESSPALTEEKSSAVPLGTPYDLDKQKISNTRSTRNDIPNLLIPNKAFVNLMWIFLALISIMTAVQILAAVRLLNATQLGKEPVGAMKLCRFWRRVCIFFTGLLVFNFFSSFRQRGNQDRGDNFFEVSFLLTSILIRIVALYIVQQFVNELDVAIASTLPLHRHHQPPSTHLNLGGDNLAYAYGPQFPPMPMPMPAQSHAPPPKYEDVVKEPYKFSAA